MSQILRQFATHSSSPGKTLGLFLMQRRINDMWLRLEEQGLGVDMNEIAQLKRIRERIEDSAGEALSLIDRSIERLRAAEGDAKPAARYSGPEIVTRALGGRTWTESGISDDEHNWEE